MVIENLLLFLAACLIMVVCGAVLIRTIITVAAFLRLKAFVAAFIIIAFSTSLPELFVGINSALQGNPLLSVGNVIGSIIADIALVAGIVLVLAKSFKLESKFVKKDAWLMILIALLPVLLMVIGRTLSRFDGIILLAAFVLYSVYIIKKGRVYTSEFDQNHIQHGKALLAILFFVASAVLLYFSSRFVVEYGVKLAIDLSVPQLFVGLIFVSLGTSLPELVFGTQAALKKHAELSIGDLMGAVIINSTLVLGVTAVICPAVNSFALFLTSSLFMFVILFVFATFVTGGRRLTWKEGISLILLYVLFLMIELNIKQYFVS